jgi:hypothetical protein
LRKNIKITFAEQDIVCAHEDIVNEILNCIGFGHAFVTDLSTFSDFSMTEKNDNEIVNKINDFFKVKIKITDEISKTALNVYRSRKENKNLH